MLNTGMETARRYWWLVVIRGVLAIIFGLIALLSPGIALLAIIFVFAAYAIVDGIVALVVGFQEHNRNNRWWLLVLEGVAGIIVGILAFSWPGITSLVLLYLVAWWAIITGIMEIVAAFMLRDAISREWLLALAGILSIIFGILLIVNPGRGLLSLLWLVGIYAIIFGIVLIVRGFQLRSRTSTPSYG